MKLKQWLYGATALAMLAACSDKDIAPGGPEDGNTTFGQGTGYLGISLELPTDPVSRAGDNQVNDRFDDGTKDEYNVDSAALLLFAGADEGSAKFIGAYEMSPQKAFDQPSHDQITVSFQQAIEVLNKPTIEGTNNFLWGLALVNYRTDHFTIVTDQTQTSNYGNLSIKNTNGTAVIKRIKNEVTGDPSTTATTFDEMRALITDCKFLNLGTKTITTDGVTSTTEVLNSIFMTNAPLCDKAGTETELAASRKVQTLAKLDKSKFKDSEQEAINDPAGCIFVERAVSKVTCTSFPAFATLKHTAITNADTGVAGTTISDEKIDIVSVDWMIDNEEKNSYIVRNAKSTDNVNYPFWDYNYNSKYRFVGGTSLANTGASGTFDGNTAGHNWYRTYWCLDPNYSGDKTFYDQANMISEYDPENRPANALDTYTNTIFKRNGLVKTGTTTEIYASNTPIYCHENTFDINHQNYQNTTRVIFKVQYDTSKQMFAIRDELGTLYFEDDAKNFIKKYVLGSVTLNDLVKGLLASGNTSVNYTENDFNMTFGIADADEPGDNPSYTKGTYYIKTLEFKDTFFDKEEVVAKTSLTAEKTAEIESTLAQVKAEANKKCDIVAFDQNVCYYPVYLKHFGDTYCPLEANKKGDTVDVIYGSNVNRYTGRYGLVRNNWYDLIVDEIKNLGKATVPDGNVTTSDDNEVDKFYLSARIHVLSWARRTQSVSF